PSRILNDGSTEDRWSSSSLPYRPRRDRRFRLRRAAPARGTRVCPRPSRGCPPRPRPLGRFLFRGSPGARAAAHRRGGRSATPRRGAAVGEIADRFRTSSATVVTQYNGLSVSQLSALRRALGTEAKYRVAKNTLVKRAAQDAGIEGMDELFIGPTAIAFVEG